MGEASWHAMSVCVDVAGNLLLDDFGARRVKIVLFDVESGKVMLRREIQSVVSGDVGRLREEGHE